MPRRQQLGRWIVIVVSTSIGFVFATAESSRAVDEPAEGRAYAEFEIGPVVMPELDITNGSNGKLDLGTGFSVGAAAGWRLTKHVRLEGHFSYREAEVEGLNLQSTPTRGSGDLGAVALLTNAYVDFYHRDWLFAPFAGAGFGFAVVRVDTQDDLGGLEIDGDAVQFAWNLVGGFVAPITPRFEFVARCGSFATEDAEVDVRGTSTTRSRVDVEFEAHEALAGLRINL
jgi:opacity protein-like surface antigen